MNSCTQRCLRDNREEEMRMRNRCRRSEVAGCSLSPEKRRDQLSSCCPDPDGLGVGRLRNSLAPAGASIRLLTRKRDGATQCKARTLSAASSWPLDIKQESGLYRRLLAPYSPFRSLTLSALCSTPTCILCGLLRPSNRVYAAERSACVQHLIPAQHYGSPVALD